MVGTCGFCLNSTEFVGLLKMIFFLVIFFPSCSDVFERMYVCVCAYVREVRCLPGSLPLLYAQLGLCACT